MKFAPNPEVAAVFDEYPPAIQKKLSSIRQLILDTAAKTESITSLEETLKWGEPSYLTKGGSTIRMAPVKGKPDHYALYFHCGTTLVATFRELYGDQLTLEGNRAIVFHQSDRIPVKIVKHCALLALTYHRRKHLPMLGV